MKLAGWLIVPEVTLSNVNDYLGQAVVLAFNEVLL